MDATGWDERYRASDLVWSSGPNATVEQQLVDHPRGRVLDLAAGEGRNAIWLAEQGFNVEALDFSTVALDRARALAEARGVSIATRVADLTLEPELDPADVVLLAYLQLTPGPLAAIHRWAAELVAPGGTFLLVAHARRNVTEGHGGPSAPEVCPTVDEVTQELRAAGLVIERGEEFDRVVETDDGPRTAIDLLVRATRPVS